MDDKFDNGYCSTVDITMIQVNSVEGCDTVTICKPPRFVPNYEVD